MLIIALSAQHKSIYYIVFSVTEGGHSSLADGEGGMAGPQPVKACMHTTSRAIALPCKKTTPIKSGPPIPGSRALWVGGERGRGHTNKKGMTYPRLSHTLGKGGGGAVGRKRRNEDLELGG